MPFIAPIDRGSGDSVKRGDRSVPLMLA